MLPILEKHLNKRMRMRSGEKTSLLSPDFNYAKKIQNLKRDGVRLSAWDGSAGRPKAARVAA